MACAVIPPPTIIIQGSGLNLPEAALQYLKLNSCRPFILHSNEDPTIVIRKEYARGVRQFILSTISSEIVSLLPLIQSMPDAKFVSGTSTLIALRGAAPNLYFTTASDQYVKLIAFNLDFVRPITAVVYTDLANPYIAEVVGLLESFGYVAFSILDSRWTTYSVLVLISLPAELETWNQLIAQMRPLPHRYNIFSAENSPPDSISFPSNVTNITVVYPLATVQPQINSYWNIACKSSSFSTGPPWTNSYPILINQRWKFLIQANLITTTYQRNNIYLARYLPTYDLHPRFNLQNPHVLKPPAALIWLLSSQYDNKETRANLNALRKFNPRIRKIRVVSDLGKAVQSYWACGWRQFVLQAPSVEIAQVQKLKLCGGVFICPRATDPSIRHQGSAFLFGLTDDTTMIQDKIVATARASAGKTVCLLGTSDNISIPLFQAELDRIGVSWLHVDSIQKLNPNTIALFVVGDKQDYAEVLDYIQANRSQYPELTKLSSYGRYITRSNLITWKEIGMTGESVVNNYNSSQPFLESEYSRISRPSYFSDEVYFWDLANILLQFPLDFLFAFGYIIDI